MTIEESKIQVYVITGFLGSGKTTFLNHFIRSHKDKKIWVIENEVGKTNIDGGLIVEGTEEVCELTAGCLCCDLNTQLYDVLFELAGKMQRNDILVVETTGIADPSSVAETFRTGAFMEKTYDLIQVICLVDVHHVTQALEASEEARRQIAFADVVLLNKCENADSSDIDNVRSLVQGIHPDVGVLSGSFGEFDISEIARSGGHTDHKEEKISLMSESYTHKHKGINTFTLTFDEPFDFRHLRHTLMLLIHIHKDQIYRIKGIIDVPDLEDRLVLQSVFKTFRFTQGSEWGNGETRQSKIVVIGKDVEKDRVERLFRQSLLKKESI